MDNRVLCPQGGYKVFANEGNNFTWIRPPANSSLKAVDAWPKQTESLSLRNRLTQSERLDLWTPVNGLTVSPLTLRLIPSERSERFSSRSTARVPTSPLILPPST